MTHPLRVAENYTTHPLHKAKNLMTHPLSAPAHPPLYFLTPYLGNIYDNTFKTVLERKCSKVIFSTIEIRSASYKICCC